VTVETRLDARAAESAERAERAEKSALSRIWYDPFYRGIVYQVLVVGIIALGLAYFISNVVTNLERQRIASGFGFLDREAGFAIGESLIPYSASDTYGRAFLVGLLNTFRVGILGILLATILGVVIGVARLSSNWLVAKLAAVYVEVMRNLPLLLQLFIWYGVLTLSLPGPRQALTPVEGVFVSNRGLRFAVPAEDPVYFWMLVAFLAAIVASFGVSRYAKRRQHLTGQQTPVGRIVLSLLLGLPFVVWLLGGAPTAMDVPELRGFNFVGGVNLSPEFAALLLGLSTYTAAFIAEIVRAGILAVPHGQKEAAAALGLSPGRTLRLVVLPQALRIIVPPTTSQYLNLFKNSSLAVAIGYPDLVSIGNTTLNQTGQAIEAISIFMAVYLFISLTISLFMNWYNRVIALKER
jgi:general L-amino acid transport system permease protein